MMYKISLLVFDCILFDKLTIYNKTVIKNSNNDHEKHQRKIWALLIYSPGEALMNIKIISMRRWESVLYDFFNSRETEGKKMLAIKYSKSREEQNKCRHWVLFLFGLFSRSYIYGIKIFKRVSQTVLSMVWYKGQVENSVYWISKFCSAVEEKWPEMNSLQPIPPVR